MIRSRGLLVVLMLSMATFISACTRSSENEAAPTPTTVPQTTNSKKFNIRVQINRDIPSLIDRYMEVQVVELIDGKIPDNPTVVGTATKPGVGHTQGLINEIVIAVTAEIALGKEYGARAGIFDSDKRETMLLTSKCLSTDDCRFSPQAAIDTFVIYMLPASDTQLIYDMGVPAEIREICSVQPSEASCGVTRSRQYYDALRDTCFVASWGGCKESQGFKNAADCLQACRKNWQ